MGELIFPGDSRPLKKVVPERTGIRTIEEQLGNQIFGQPEAVSTVARLLNRVENGYNDPDKPYASVLCLGQTGVGKTELGKAVAQYMFGEEQYRERMKIIDCQEFSERHTVARLVGAPPGYVGYNELPVIDHDWLQAGRSVIIFDEIEKADPAFHKMLYAILDEGRLNARRPKTGASEPLHFDKSFIILTSNVGDAEIQYISRSTPIGFLRNDRDRSKAIQTAGMRGLQSAFSAPFIGRLDETIVFHPLESQDMSRILDKFVTTFQERAISHRVVLPFISLTPAARARIINEASLEYGGRGLKKVFNKNLGDDIYALAAEGKLNYATQINVDVENGEFVFYTDDIEEETNKSFTTTELSTFYHESQPPEEFPEESEAPNSSF